MIAIYARQSIDKKDSISIDSQIEYAKKEIGSEEYKTYIDKGFSGGNTNRPQFEQMMKDIKKGEISKIVVYKLDRISRSITDFANIINILQDNKVDFVSATEKFDTSSPMGRAMVYIIMVFAQLERETIAQRIKDNYYARGKKGFFLGGNCPYGFINKRTIVDGKKTSILEQDNTLMPIVKEIFIQYSQTNKSLADIKKYLDSNKIKSPQGVNWDTIKINRILRNPAYVKADADIYTYFSNKGYIIHNELLQFTGQNGCLLFGKRTKSASKYAETKDQLLTIGQHKGVINSKIWLQCQYKLDTNKQIKNSGKGKYTWLSGLTKCGYCNYAMTVTQWKHTKYFNCRGKSSYKVCDVKHKTHYVNEIEAYVELEIRNRFLHMNPINFDNDNTSSTEVNQLKLQVIDIDNRINQLIDKLALSNDVVMDYINKKIKELDLLKKNILKTIEDNNINNQTTETIFEISQKISDWDNLDIEEKKEIARKVIDKIFITNDEIKIAWKY
ncbi:MAG: recombinase family protein [Vallitalea sp.]|nr:recombinase family protein [Vallitalea sp.]